jgi:hypothetical protein
VAQVRTLGLGTTIRRAVDSYTPQVGSIHITLADGSTRYVRLDEGADVETELQAFVHPTEDEWTRVDGGYVRRKAIIAITASADEPLEATW